MSSRGKNSFTSFFGTRKGTVHAVFQKLLECYHCGQEFHNEEQMKNHPNMCDRMKNARNYGQVNLQEFSQSIQSTGYNNDLYDNGIKIAKSNHKRKKTNKPTGK